MCENNSQTSENVRLVEVNVYGGHVPQKVLDEIFGQDTADTKKVVLNHPSIDLNEPVHLSCL